MMAGEGSEMGAELLFFICTSFYGHFAPQPLADRVRSECRWCVFWIDVAVREQPAVRGVMLALERKQKELVE